jgi:Secretion system C-terminal sorting domain
MRKNSLILAILIIANCRSFAQNCAPNGITTNPVSPVNTQNPSKINLFDFTATSFNWKYSSGLPPDNIVSPFFSTDNASISHLYDPIDGIKDIYPAEGWEIIKKDFGYDDANVACGFPNTCAVSETPYMVLYNKFKGLLRVFVARGELNPAPANGVTMKISFNSDNRNQTSLLDFESPLVAIDAPFARDKNLFGVAKFYAPRKKWFYCDFPMQYDPCTCLNPSKLVIEIFLSNTSTVTLEGTSTGTIVSQGAPTPAQDSKSQISVGDIVKGGKSLLEKFKKDDEAKNDMIGSVNVTINNSGTLDIYNKVSGIGNLFNSAKSPNFLKSGFSAIPYLDKALDVVNFLFGGGKTAGPQQVELLPMSINMTHKFTGLIKTEIPYNSITLRTPGSLFNGYPNSEYPYYNEVMGVFNLLTTPVFLIKSGSSTPVPSGCSGENRSMTYRLKSPIQYVLNPASGLQVVEINAALSIDGKFNCGDFLNFEGYNPNNSSFQSRTNYVNLSCMRQQIYKAPFHAGLAYLNSTNPVESPGDNVRVKFMVRLRRLNATTNTQDILLAVTYPAQLEISTNLGTVTACSNTLVQQPEAAGVVHSFCQSTYASSNRFLKADIDNNIDPLNNSNSQNFSAFKVYPTITKNVLNVSYSLKTGGLVNISIRNSVGQLIQTLQNKVVSAGSFSFQSNLNNLNSGMYFISFTAENRVVTKKFVVAQ